MCGLMSDLVILKFRKVYGRTWHWIPYWDQVSLKNTSTNPTHVCHRMVYNSHLIGGPWILCEEQSIWSSLVTKTAVNFRIVNFDWYLQWFVFFFVRFYWSVRGMHRVNVYRQMPIAHSHQCEGRMTLPGVRHWHRVFICCWWLVLSN